MFNLDYNIKDEAIPLLARLSDAVRSKALRDIMGRSGRNRIVAHFEERGRSRHRAHVAHNYWQDAADSTHYRTETDGATVVISQPGVSLHLQGGEVRAVKGKLRLLHIPVDIESEGKTPREFDDLQWIVNKRTRKGVVKRKSDNKVLFALTEVAQFTADPSVLPDDVLDHVSRDVAAFMRRRWSHVQ